MSLLGIILVVLPRFTAGRPGRTAVAVIMGIFWVTLPLFFFWMYLRNGGNGAWLATVSATFVIYYHLTDWRLATLGTVSGMLMAWGLFLASGATTIGLANEQLVGNSVVLAFSWYMGLVLGLSSSNLRREQLNYTLGTMGIMAHELRTPLATMSLLGDAIRNEALEHDASTREQLEKLVHRLHTLVRNMNHQIDMQISNARLMRLPSQLELVSAGELVRQSVQQYPYRTSRERECVTVQVLADFNFEGSRMLFSQVLDNLLKNALRSLAAATTASQPGDLLVEVGVDQTQRLGRIVITDRGVGMDEGLQARIFQPFFSTDHGTGHGLGLAFCQRVVQDVHGSIRVKSSSFQGAAFTIELPLAADTAARARLVTPLSIS